MEITNIHDKSLKGFKHLNAQHAKLKEYLDKFQGLLAKVSVTYEMEKPTENKIYPLYNHTKNFTITNESEITSFFKNAKNDLLHQIHNKEQPPSGMVFKGLNTMQISVGKYMPTRGGSYIQLPKFISDKKACINIKNENDDNCFKYSVQCGYYKIYENRTPNEWLITRG